MVTDPLEEDVPPVNEIDQARERGFVPGRVWQCLDREGNLLAETSNPQDFVTLELIDRTDVGFFLQFVRRDEEWVKMDPKAIKEVLS